MRHSWKKHLCPALLLLLSISTSSFHFLCRCYTRFPLIPMWGFKHGFAGYHSPLSPQAYITVSTLLWNTTALFTGLRFKFPSLDLKCNNIDLNMKLKSSDWCSCRCDGGKNNECFLWAFQSRKWSHAWLFHDFFHYWCANTVLLLTFAGSSWSFSWNVTRTVWRQQEIQEIWGDSRYETMTNLGFYFAFFFPRGFHFSSLLHGGYTRWKVKNKKKLVWWRESDMWDPWFLFFFLGGGAGNGLRCFRKLSRIDWLGPDGGGRALWPRKWSQGTLPPHFLLRLSPRAAPRLAFSSSVPASSPCLRCPPPCLL